MTTAMKYLKTLTAVAVLALATGSVKADPRIIGRSFGEIVQLFGKQPTTRVANKLVWVGDDGVSDWLLFNSAGACIEASCMTSTPWNDRQVLVVLKSEFCHLDGWKDWIIGPVHYWRDAALNSAIYGYDGEHQKYFLLISRSDAENGF
jgi:hypothetical protein